MPELAQQQPQSPKPENPASSASPIAPVVKTKKKAPKEKDKKKQVKQFMGQWFEQYFKFVTIAACIILLAASSVFVLYPEFIKARSLSGTKYEKVIQHQQGLQAQLDYLIRAQADKRKITQQDIKNIGLLLPSDPATAQILTSLEDIAKQSNAAIEGVDLVILDQEEMSDEDIAELPSGINIVEINATVASSPYNSLKDFLSTIEKNIRIMDVIAVTYSPIGKSYTLTIRAYYMP